MLLQPRITSDDARRHLHDIRIQRQRELAFRIDQCHRLQMKHKYIFDCQWKCDTNKEFSLRKNEIIYEKNHGTVEEGFNDYIADSGLSIVFNNKKPNHRLISPKMKNRQRCVSVSPVASIDKRTNQIYENWPDYPQISQIVGYRIEKTVPKIPAVVEKTQTKRKKTTRFAIAAKQIQDMSSTQRDEFKNKPVNDPPVINIASKEIQPQLPTFLCPSSKIYSQRIATRQWLIQNSSSLQTLPLI